MFKLKPSPVSEQDTTELDSMYKEYERRVLFKLNGIETQRHDQICIDECVCFTRQQVVHEWEDWAIKNFGHSPENIDWIPQGRKYVNSLEGK